LGRDVKSAIQQGSITCFSLVAYGEDGCSIAIQTIENDIAAFTEINQPFPIMDVHLIHRPAGMGLMGQDPDARSNGLYGATCSMHIL
jgi:hypothetical protein